MPRGDRTGPNGVGPMTGRAAGFCGGNDRPGYAAGGFFGRGGGFGRGFGRGFNRGWGFRPFSGYGAGPVYPEYTPERETVDLKEEARLMENRLNEIKQRLADLEKSEKSEK
ncbi:MAG TPA: hypothetical protein ENN72_07545 [Firmicutes bacterium]|nr:hypothetical protein [Bacillota bacterium]